MKSLFSKQVAPLVEPGDHTDGTPISMTQQLMEEGNVLASSQRSSESMGQSPFARSQSSSPEHNGDGLYWAGAEENDEDVQATKTKLSVLFQPFRHTKGFAERRESSPRRTRGQRGSISERSERSPSASQDDLEGFIYEQHKNLEVSVLSTTASSAMLGRMLVDRKSRKSKRKRRVSGLVGMVFGRDRDAMSKNPYARASMGALLAVAESKPGPDFLSARLIPALEILIAFAQLLLLNQLLLPSFLPMTAWFMEWLEHLLYWRLFSFRTDAHLNLNAAVVLVLTSMGGMLLIGTLLRYNIRSPLVLRVVPTYIRLVTGVGFLPICDSFLVVVYDVLRNPARASVQQDVDFALVIFSSLFFLPFCFIISQNKFDSDENSVSLICRVHNRTDMLYLVVKMLLLVAADTPDVLRYSMQLALFVALLTAHYGTHIYFKRHVNKFYNGAYFILALGAACRLIPPALCHISPTNERLCSARVGYIAELVYWAMLLPAFYVAWAHDSLHMVTVRFRINDFLMSRLRFLDLADKPDLIQRFDIVHELRSATRIGRYAQLLVVQGQYEAAAKEFDRALVVDPNHPDNLGNYAMLLWRLNKTATVGDMFERALRRNPQHRYNLESYASFLNQTQQQSTRATQLYQRSLHTYFEHLHYRDLYSLSSDAMFIVQATGKVVDCNAAAMTLFRARCREDLCGPRSDVLNLFYHVQETKRFTAMLGRVADIKSTVQTDRMPATMRVGRRPDVIIQAQICATSVKRGRHSLVHVSIVDVTELQNAVELSTQTFQKGANPMIMIDSNGLMHQVNDAAIAFLGYKPVEVMGRNVSMFMPEPHRTQHDGYLKRYMQTGEAKIIGSSRLVPVITKNGTQKLCTLKVNRMTIAQGITLFIGVLQDVTQLREAMLLADACFDGGREPMIVINESGIIERWNQCASTTFKYTTEEAVGQNVSFLMPEPHRSQHSTYLWTYISSGESKILGKDRDVPVVTKDGEKLVCSLKVNEVAVGSRRLFIGLFNNVTQLVTAVALSAHCFEDADDPMMVINEAGIIQKWNACASSTFGYSAGDTIGKNISLLMPEPHRSQHDSYLKRYLDTGEHRVIGKAREVPVLTKKGKRLTCTLKVNALDIPGEMKMFIGILNDVTALTDALSMANACFDEANDPMVVIDEAGIIQKWNACAAETFHYSSEEAIGRNLSFLMPEPHRSQHDGYLKRYLDTGEKRVIGRPRDVPVVTGKGTSLVCNLKVNELHMKGTSRRMFVGLLHDVTRLMQAMSMADACFDEANDPMVVIDEAGIIQRWNACAAATFHYPADEAMGQNISFLMPDSYKSQHDQYLCWYLVTGKKKIIGKSRDVPVITKLGNQLTCNLKVNELRLQDKRRMFVGILHDVTDTTMAREMVEGIFEVSGSPQLLLSAAGVMLRLNGAAYRAFGYDKDHASVAQKDVALLLPDDHARVKEILATDGPKQGGTLDRVLMRCRDGSSCPAGLEVKGFVLPSTRERCFIATFATEHVYTRRLEGSSMTVRPGPGMEGTQMIMEDEMLIMTRRVEDSKVEDEEKLTLQPNSGRKGSEQNLLK